MHSVSRLKMKKYPTQVSRIHWMVSVHILEPSLQHAWVYLIPFFCIPCQILLCFSFQSHFTFLSML